MHKRVKNNGAPLIMLAMALLTAGIAAITLPVLMTDRELRRDAETYEAFNGLVKSTAENTTDLSQERKERAIEPAQQEAAQPMPTEYTPTHPPNAVSYMTGADLTACKAANDDFAAWLQIPGTPVDYPVVWSDDTEYWLHHTFTGKKSYLGTLFSLRKTDYQTPGKNIAIYGHHIRSKREVMFSPLLAYKDAGYYTGHETVYLDTLYGPGTYTIFAIINMQVDDWDPSAAAFAGDADFLAFVDQARAQSLYDTGVDVTVDDKLLTLITCDRSYGGKNGRLVVMAVKR